jgi:hypothetical protein
MAAETLALSNGVVANGDLTSNANPNPSALRSRAKQNVVVAAGSRRRTLRPQRPPPPPVATPMTMMLRRTTILYRYFFDRFCNLNDI